MAGPGIPSVEDPKKGGGPGAGDQLPLRSHCGAQGKLSGFLLVLLPRKGSQGLSKLALPRSQEVALDPKETELHSLSRDTAW